MPLKIDRSPRAKSDAFEIWDYIAADSPQAAERMLRRIDKAISMLAERPDGGRANEDLGTGIRSFPVERYLIFYRHSDTQLNVIRLLHAARDIKPQMLSE